ncbi:MAG: hypothetical protein U5J83_18335 [Bryobacterales bacterium]|nr:hypothetical protein [Bryobacterales bacterium]
MVISVWNRREWIAASAGAMLCLTDAGVAQDAPAEYYEMLRWFERRPGSTEPRVLDGKLVVNHKEEKVAFFAGYTNRFEAPFKKVKSLTYEFAKRPSDLSVPASDWQKTFKRGERHFLVFEYQDKGGYFKKEILELHKKNWSEVLKALEYATGLGVKRI